VRQHFQCGDCGIVRSGLLSFDGGMPYYLVAMGEDERGTVAAFRVDEIEPDVPSPDALRRVDRLLQ
jgi:hypothetical protein